MKFYEDKEEGAKILLNDLIFLCYRKHRERDTKSDIEVMLYKISRKTRHPDVFSTIYEVKNMLIGMMPSEFKEKYEELAKRNYKPQIISFKQELYKNKTLLDVIKDSKNEDEINFYVNKNKIKPYKKIKFFNFEEENYVLLLDEGNNSKYYKYKKVDDKEILFPLEDKLLIDVFKTLNN